MRMSCSPLFLRPPRSWVFPARGRGRRGLRYWAAGLALVSAVGCGTLGSINAQGDNDTDAGHGGQQGNYASADGDSLAASPALRAGAGRTGSNGDVPGSAGTGSNGNGQRTTRKDDSGIGTSAKRSGSLASSSVTRDTLVGQIRRIAARRGDEVSVAVYDRTTGRTFTYNNDDVYCTASIMKVALMAVLMYKDEQAGESVTAQQRQLLTRMIEHSDNSAATQIWNDLGRGPGITPVLRKWGLTHTTLRGDGYWGLTQTTASDQVRLLQVVDTPNGCLKPADQALARALMTHVEADQRWGVSGGVPSDATVALKDGWSPAALNNWRINSIGMVQGEGRNYLIAVLTFHNPTEAYGIQTITDISSLVWKVLTPVKKDGD
jgi:beta-lactamase class A